MNHKTQQVRYLHTYIQTYNKQYIYICITELNVPTYYELYVQVQVHVLYVGLQILKQTERLFSLETDVLSMRFSC